MILQDYHIHTTFCDGKNSAEEMVQAAVEKGMTAMGFSGHSHMAFDESWCMSVEDTGQYRREIARLREEYADRIDILCGVEQDFYSDADTAGYDYIIGSVHYLCVDGNYIPVDESPEILRTAAEKHFGGDIYALAEAYYATVGQVWERTHCDIIGHFDLITKFNEGGVLFDESEPRYVRAWHAAADKLLESGALFEVNTGAISRGYRTAPYPAAPIRQYLTEHGARFILSSDSHAAGGLCFRFDELEGTIDGLTTWR
ncbi:MAG: histidinol-phosphatase [Clostridiales bacterium]|nr:histidinol-phosphatase [Candidatus Cacconaster stercorequi]